jgi:hypothetical protein
MTPTDTLCYLPNLEEHLLDEQLAAWQAGQPKMGVLVLLPEAERDAVSRIQQVCTRRRIPLVGAVFPALTEGGSFRTQGAWLLRFDEMPYTAMYPDLPREPEKIPAALDAITADIKSHLGDSHDITLFMLFDAMVPNIATLLDQLYLRLANRVRYMGANAGSESFKPMPCLFDGSRVIQNGVLTILLKPHHGAVLEHGYGVPTQMLTATSTEGNRILQIDWRPAFEVYQEMARAQYGVEITQQNFYQYGVHFPFGIVRANGMTLVRIPVALEQDGSLFCVGEVPPNALLTLLKAPAVDSAQTIAALMEGLEQLGGSPAGQQLLLFYCAGRRLHLGIEAAETELGLFAQRTQAKQIAGALSLGEIGGSTRWGYPLFHNATLVASYWGHNGT